MADKDNKSKLTYHVWDKDNNEYDIPDEVVQQRGMDNFAKDFEGGYITMFDDKKQKVDVPIEDVGEYRKQGYMWYDTSGNATPINEVGKKPSPSKEKEQSQYPQEVKRGELKKPSLISQALGMMPKVDAGNIGREQKMGGMITSMLLGGNEQQAQPMQQPQDNNQQVQQTAQGNASQEQKQEPAPSIPSVVNDNTLMDAKFANYLEDWKKRPDKEGNYFENFVADLEADGMNPDEALEATRSAQYRYAHRSAMDVTNQVVSSLPDDTVQDAEQSIGAQWYSHGVQDKLKQEADSMGISYDDYVAHFLKPAMVQSLVNKYGPNYRNIAEGIATRLYSHDENVQDRLMKQDIDEALLSVISKYVNPSVVEEYNKAQEEGSKAFTEGMEGSQFIPANLRLGTALGAQYEANEAKDPAKVLSGLQQKFGKLYRNPKFLNDMSNAAFKVMQRYGLNGTQSSDPKQFKPMINAAIKNELDQLEVKGMMPKGSAEYIMKTGLGNTIAGKIIRKAVQTDYQNWLEDIANQQYQPGFWENVVSGALTFAGDAWSYWLPGAAGGKLTKSMVAKAEGRLAGDLMAKGMERKMAERAAKVLISKSKAAALKSGAVHGAVTFGGQSAISKPIDEVYRTGQFDENGMIYNPSVGKVIANTLGEVAKQSAVGAIMQGGTIANMVGKGRGLATNILADVGGKVVDSGIMTGQQILERMAQDPNFKPTGKDAAESFLESMANLTAIGLPGMVGKYARFKDAREFNKKFDFTDQDIAELKRFGYDGLRDAFEKVSINGYRAEEDSSNSTNRTKLPVPYAEETQVLNLTQKYMDLMNDKSVPEVLKAKMMAVVEGKRPSSFSPVVDSVIVQPMDHDGKVYLETLNKDGGIIDRKEFSSLDEAQKADKKLEYEKTLGLASVLEGEFHNEFTQEHLEDLYNQAAQKYYIGYKLTDEEKAAVYLRQNAGTIDELIHNRQNGIILTDEEQKQLDTYRHFYDSALENSSVLREFVQTFEDSHGVARGTLRKALESKDKKYAPLVESYLKELYNSIELKREMKDTKEQMNQTEETQETTGSTQEGGASAQNAEATAEKPVDASVSSDVPPTEPPTPPVGGETPSNADDTPSVENNVSPSDADTASNESKSDAFVMGQNAYKNGDSEALQAIGYNSDLATGRLQRAFADNEKMPDIVANAYNEGRDMEQFVAQRASSLTPAQKEAISKYVEAMDAKKGAIDALQHADDGYGEALKEQLWPYQTEDGNIVPATLDSGKQVFLKKDNEYGGAFVVVPDEQGLPTIKQVSKASIIEKGTPVSLDEYIEKAVAQQKDARNKQFISQFDGSGLKPNDRVTVAMEEGDDNIDMTFAGYSEDGKIVLTDGKDYLPLSKEEFAAWRKNALDNTINEHLDAEDDEREQKAVSQAEADKKQRYANGIVGLSEGQPDYSSKDTDPNVAAEYLQEQFGEDHGKLLNLVNGSRDDIETQLANKKKAAAEYRDWLDVNADLDPEKAQKVENDLALVNEQIADLDARFKNWNAIRNSVMTPDEVKAMKEERKAEIERAGIDKFSVLPDVDTGVRIPENSELKDKYPTQEAASGYITSERRRVYKMQEETQREIDGVDKILNQYMDGDMELSAEQLRDLNTTKAELANRQNALTADAKALKGKAESLNILYIKERAEQNKKNLEALSPKDRRKELVAKALEEEDMKAIKEIYKDASTDVMDLAPRTLEEFVSERLFPHSLNAESLAQELGSSNFSRGIGSKYDTNKFNYLLAKKGEGLTINELAKRVWEDLSGTMESGAGDGLQSTYKDQDVRNAILDMFKTYDSVREMRNVTLLNRIAAAENELSGEEEWYEQQKEREIFEKQKEIDEYKSYIHDKELSLPSESELDYINGLEFDRMMEIEDREREYKQYVKSILPELADYDDRSNEEGYGGGSSLGSNSSRRGVDEGNSQGEEVGNGEASSESEIGEGSDSGRKGRQETGSMEPGEGSAVRGSHLPQEASFGERLKSAIAETETEPTEAQKKAGNYKKGHLSFGGYDFTVETPKGVTRSGKDEQGKPWSVTMHDTYGYILGKIGVDGDHIDMFINDDADLDSFDGNVCVVDQVNPETGEFDEHKVMYGYPSEEAATEAYLANYSKGWKGLGKVTSVPKATFDKWLESSDRKTKPFAEYAMIQHEEAKKANNFQENSEKTSENLPSFGKRNDILKDNPILREARKKVSDTLDELDKFRADKQSFFKKIKAIFKSKPENDAIVEARELIAKRRNKYPGVLDINGFDYNKKYAGANLPDEVYGIYEKAYKKISGVEHKIKHVSGTGFLNTISDSEALENYINGIYAMFIGGKLGVKFYLEDNLPEISKQVYKIASDDIKLGRVLSREGVNYYDPNLRFADPALFDDPFVPNELFSGWLEKPNQKKHETLPFDAPMSMDDLSFHRDVKEVKPSEMTEAQKVAYDAVSTMLKKAGIPVKVVSNEDMEKVAEAQDNLNLAMLLNQPEMRFKIKTPEEKQAAENAYNFAKELRPDKWKQYAVVNMSNPNRMPEYFEKQELARKERSYYNKLMWGNYKVFNLDKSFEDNVAGLTGSFPSEFDAYKIDEQTNKRNELKRQIKETEDAYNSTGQERNKYQIQLMKEYMDEHGLTSENDIPDDVWSDLNDKAHEKYQDKLDSLFAKYKDLDRQLNAVAEPGVKFLRTYHGTGAKFDKFDLSHALEGEGSETFGHGVYVTNSEKIGSEYAQRAKDKKATFGFEFVNPQSMSKQAQDMLRHYMYKHQDVAKGLENARKDLKDVIGKFPDTDYLQELNEILAKDDDSIAIPSNRAYRYDVDIPDDNGSNYLGWNESQNFPLEKWYRLWEITHNGFSENEYFNDGGARYNDDRIERILQMKLESPENGMQKLPTLKGEDLYRALEDFFNRERPSYGAELASRALNEIGFVGIKYPAGMIHGGAKEGDYNYVIFDENNVNIVGNTKFAQGKGVVYGYTDGKEIVLNQEHLNPNTPIHEYQHLWRTAAKNMNPELIEHGDKLIMQTQLFADLKQDPNYNHLTDEQICDEAFARLTGEDGAAILEQMAKDAIKENPLDTAKELSVINKLKEWLKKFWYWTLDTFTKWKPEDIKKMTLEDIRNLVLRDLANGVDPRNVKFRMTKENAVSLRKQMADNAEQERILEHTEENWQKEFGKDSRVTTPIGSIKLGENQYKKAGRNDRIKRFGLLKPTLERPDVILEKSAPKEGAERQTKYLFIKSFKKADGNKILNYESITVKQGEEEVAISAHQIDPSKVLKELTESKVLWNRFRGDSNSLGENQGSALTPSANNPSGKDSVLNPHSDANIRNNIETTKGNGGNLSVEDKIKAVSQQFGVDEADVAMYANAVKKGSTAEAARARANIKRHLLQVNEDKISSLKELLKYTVPVNNALKENFGDLDAMIEERVKQVEAQRNAMEAARKRAEEEEAKRQKHLEELSVIPDDQLDKQYMDALAKGDDATAREMLDEAARRKGYDDTESAYQGVGAWAAPGNPGYESDKARRDDWESSGSDVNLEDIALGYAPQPDDYFSHPERYSQNTPHGLESVKAINTAIDAIKNGEKDVKVKVYRAVPTSVKEGKLRNGDWVTPSKKYAEMHGTNRLEGKYRIIEDEVPATQLWWDGNDANEFGFDDGKEYKYKNAKNNRKLNDLVTYDNKGDVIPPSKRFNSRKSDVRFMFAGEKVNVKPRLGSATIGLKAAKDKVVELFHKAKSGEFNGKPQSIGTLTQEGKKFLEDLSGLKMKDKIDFVLNPSDLKHMNKDHFGDNEKDPGRNIPLTEEDLRSMVDVIMNPEQVVYGIEKMDNRKAFFFLKQAEDGTLNLAEIYSDKKGNLTAKSYYKTKKGVDQRVMEIKNSLLPTPEASSGSPLSDGKGINFFSIEQEKTAENERKIADSVVNTANKLGGAEATVYFSLDDVPEEYRSEIEQGAKGWYDPETHSVHVYLPNCEDGNDAQRTVFHEKIGHEGMEVLLGGEDGVRKFANFVYRSVGKDVRGKIIDFANKYDPDWKNPDRMNVGTQEYIARLAEEGPKSAEDFTLWTKIKHYLIRLLKKLGIRVPGLLNDKDLRYYLMKAGKALHVWDNMPKEKQEAMMKQANNAEIKDALSNGPGKGKPQMKKGESTIQYMKRVQKWRKWKNAREDKEDPEPPMFYDIDKDEAGKKERERLNKEWRKRHELNEDLYAAIHNREDKLVDAVPYIVEVPKRLSEVSEGLNDTDYFKNRKLSVSSKDLESVLPLIDELKSDIDGIKLDADGNIVSQKSIADKIAKKINSLHILETSYTPLTSADILNEHVLPILEKDVFPKGKNLEAISKSRLPVRKEGETNDEYQSRINEYEKWQEAMNDQEDPMPDMFAFEKKKQEEVKRKYEDWLAKHDLLEQQQADLDLYEGKIYPAETNPKADALEQQVMQDLAEVTSTDVSKEGAAKTVKHAVIHRRKNMEEASADDAIYINDVKNRIEKMADSGAFDKLLSDYKGKPNRAEKLAEAIPYIIEAPRRLRDLAHDLNATDAFDKGHIHIQPDDVEAIQPFVADLIAETAKMHTVLKDDKEVKVYDDPQAVSEVANKLAQAINANHQGEEGFVPIDGTDILSKHVLPLVMQQIVPKGIDYKNLSPEMKSTIDSIRDWYNYTYDWLKDNHTLKEDAGYNVDYVNHIWDKEKSDKQAYAMYVENRQRTKSPNEKPRTISTLMEGISVGLVPKTTDITKMMAYYSRSNIEAWANKTMLQELSGLNVIERNEDGEIVSSDPLLSSTPPFNLEQYQYFEIPGVGPVWVYNVSPKQVKVKNPITGKERVLYSEASAGDRFGVVFETYQSSPFWKAFDTLASSAKKLELGFSGFHAGALTEVYMVQNMVEFGPKKAMANFMKYIFVDTMKNHQLPCFANPEDFQEAATHLVKFGATNDYAAADVQNMFDNMRDAMIKVQEKLKDGNKISGTVALATMPLKVATQMLSLINKGMDRALWDFLHDGLKLATYRMRADKTKERAKKKGWTEEELSRALDEDGQFVNDMFGGQHWDVLGASHRTLRYAGRVLLSPDWNASTTRHFLALTGYGSIWNEATFENFKQYYQRLKHKELIPEDEGRRSRQISALLCYGIGFMVFYEGIANGINAAFRALDEEKERKKAEEIRKTNPSYKSMYELAYPDGMKWYDYLMRGNSLGQQSKIFLGRYEDGTEMYVRHGKQFREVPEYLFNHKGELEFPGPMVQRMIGKANPMVRMTLDDINYLSDFQASHADQEIQRKYGKTIGLLYKDALYWAPFLIPSQENKEFKAVDVFFPSSKGFSPWKAQSYFKDFILSGDMEGVVMTYQSCQRNGIDAEAQIKAAIGSVKALESAEMSDGVTSLQEASKRFDAAKSITEKKKMRQKMKKFLSQSEYKAFTQKEALDMVQGYLNGDEDLKEMEKAESKYLMKAKAEDVTEDWRIQNVWNGTMETYQEYQRLKDVDKAKANAFKNSKTNKRLFAARKAISAARRKMNKAKKQMDGTNDAAKLVEIRNTRKELLKTLNGME